MALNATQANRTSGAAASRRTRWMIFLAIGGLMAVGGMAMVLSAREAEQVMRQTVLSQARMLVESIDQDRFLRLTASAVDEQSADYHGLRDMLIRMREANPTYRYLYLMGQRESGPPFFFMGTAPADSDEYSPPGQPYPEDAPALAQVFQSGEATLSDPVRDRWGTWISALVPLRDRSTGRLLAVFGMDIDAGEWQASIRLRTILAGALTLASACLLLLLFFGILNRQRAQAARLLREQNRLLEQQAAERKRASEELESFFTVNLDLLCMADMDGNFVKTNEAWSRILGYSTEDLNRMKFLDFVHPEDLPATLAAMKNLRQGEEILNFTNRYRGKDGSYRQIEWRSRPYRDRIYAAARDVTERQQMEDALRVSGERLDRAMAVKNEGVWDWNLATQETYFDDRYYTMAGYAPNEFPQDFTAWEEHVHPEDLPSAHRAIQAYLGGQAECFDTEFRFRHKDGTWIWIQGRGKIVARNAQGEPLRMIGTHTDITERKQAEIRLRESEAKFRSIVEGSPVGYHIYALAEDGKLVFRMYNPAADAILGVRHEAFMGRAILEAFPALAGTGIPEMYSAVARGEWGTQNFELPYDHEGIRGVFEVRVFRGAPGQAVVNFVDISERKRAEAAIARAHLLVEAKNQELEQLVYVASHDLRSPLVNVDGFSRELEYSLQAVVRLLEGGAGRVELEKGLRDELPGIGRSLDRIRASTRQMDSLIKGLLSLSRMGRAALQIGAIDMNSVMRQLAGSFAFRVQKAGITLTVGPLPGCRGDATQVTQVFSNLIDNAIKYRRVDRAGVITVRGSVAGETAVYWVEDNGIGIAEPHREKVFELFYRLNPRETEGDGLGLTAARQILTRLGGEIRLESKEGEGCVFVVTLPLADGGRS